MHVLLDLCNLKILFNSYFRGIFYEYIVQNILGIFSEFIFFFRFSTFFNTQFNKMQIIL